MPNKYYANVKFKQTACQICGNSLNGVQPGDTLNADILINPREDVDCRGVWIEIALMETGHGSPYEKRLQNIEIHKGAMRRGEPIPHSISFQVPKRLPPTYHGDYVKFRWIIRIRIDVPLWFDDRDEYEFIVIPRIVKDVAEAAQYETL